MLNCCKLLGFTMIKPFTAPIHTLHSCVHRNEAGPSAVIDGAFDHGGDLFRCIRVRDRSWFHADIEGSSRV
jgi:hypothetical protein